MFAVAAGMAAFVYYELGRRQKLQEDRDERRREWVDDHINKLEEDGLGHRERSAGVRNVGKALVGMAVVGATIVAAIALFATHAI